jgi:hypothetical protein
VQNRKYPIYFGSQKTRTEFHNGSFGSVSSVPVLGYFGSVPRFRFFLARPTSPPPRHHPGQAPVALRSVRDSESVTGSSSGSGILFYHYFIFPPIRSSTTLTLCFITSWSSSPHAAFVSVSSPPTSESDLGSGQGGQQI